MRCDNEVSSGFGRQLFSCDLKKERRVTKLMLALFSICLLYGVAFVYFGDSMVNASPDILLFISLFAMAVLSVCIPFFLLMRHFLFPANAATVYESGLILKRGSKTIAQSFRDLEKIEFTPFDWTKRVQETYTIRLIKKDGSKPIVARVPDFKSCSHALRSAFMQYKERNARYSSST